MWADAARRGEEAIVVVGSHLDAVPDGGWLDGALGRAAPRSRCCARARRRAAAR